MNIVCILLARGGSKGIPRKNLIDFCGKPLLVWSIEQCLATEGISSVWVSSDSLDILQVASDHGANVISRPLEFAKDTSTSESAWLHALEFIENENGVADVVVAPQVTSPLRKPEDLQRGIDKFATGQYDSLFSCSLADDLYFWQMTSEGILESVNYDWRNRKRRQDHAPQYIENGSFYLFNSEVLRNFNNRFGKKIGFIKMEFWQTFEVDSPETLPLCTTLMREFLLKE